MISYKEISQVFELRGGKIYWCHRSPSQFKRESNYKAFLRNKAGKEVLGGLNAQGYPTVRYKFNDVTKNITLHRIVYCLYNKVDLQRGQVVDHIDRDPTNNNPTNLRLVSYSQNQLNRPIKGVYRTKLGWMVSRGVWGNKRAKTFCDAVKLRQEYLDVFAA